MPRRQPTPPKPPGPEHLDLKLDEAPAGNRAQHAYLRLRTAIEDGTLPPGRRLMEVQVSTWLKISRTPVREAMGRLEAEGLLASNGAGGLSVVVHDATAIRELYDIRETLEGAAAAMAARHAEAHEIEMLRAQVAMQESLPPDAHVHAGENKLFHESLYAAAHNRFLLKSVQALKDAMILLGQTTFAVAGRIESSIVEHRAIVEAIGVHDAARAEAAARSHIRHGYTSRVQAMMDALRAAALERSRNARVPAPALPSDRPARPAGRGRR